jgi:hypothetical protein
LQPVVSAKYLAARNKQSTVWCEQKARVTQACSKDERATAYPYNALTRPATRMLTGKAAREHLPCSRLLQQTSKTHPVTRTRLPLELIEPAHALLLLLLAPPRQAPCGCTLTWGRACSAPCQMSGEACF